MYSTHSAMGAKAVAKKWEHKLIVANVSTVFFDISCVTSARLHCASIQNGKRLILLVFSYALQFTLP